MSVSVTRKHTNLIHFDFIASNGGVANFSSGVHRKQLWEDSGMVFEYVSGVKWPCYKEVN